MAVEIKNKRDMKKSLIAIAMVLTLSINADAVAQKHRHTPRTEQVDSTKDKKDAIEAFSDTTSVADADDAEDDKYITYRHGNISDEDAQAVKGILEGVGSVMEPWAVISIVTIVVMFLLAPLLIIIAIFYFVNKNRKERYKLAQMAIEKGQPIPDNILKDQVTDNMMTSREYQTGIRQMFTGLGLAIFLGLLIGKIGVGIGALVFFIGLGKWFIARQSGDTGNDSLNNHSANQFNNNSNIQNNG